MCTALIDGLHPSRVTVLKFGSSLLRNEAGFRLAVDEVRTEVGRRHRVVVVVSAVAGATDGLLARARGVSRVPGAALVAALLRTGEDASVALMGLALTDAGIDAHVLGADDLGLTTVGPLDDGDPVDVDVGRLTAGLQVHAAVVVPGFVGRTSGGEPSLLGRGGSDLTALYLASRLGADRVRLVKDVPGVLPGAPAPGVEPVEPLPTVSWEEAERIGGGVVQTKALRFASSAGLEFHVAGVGTPGTRVGRGGAR